MQFRLKSGLISVGVILVLSICTYGSLIARAEGKPKKVKQSKQNAIVVQVTQVSKADIPQSVQALGSLEAVQKVVISAEDAGRVTAINFKSGQQVVKGMPIAQLDNAKATAEYQSAVTSLNVIETKYKRSKLLLNEAISQQELDQLQSDVESAKANVQKAQSVLNSKQVFAPFNGVLGTFNVQVGDYIAVGTPMVTIVNTKQLQIDYSISENSIPQLKTGQLVQVKVDA